jgi:hypothetical protein
VAVIQSSNLNISIDFLLKTWFFGVTIKLGKCPFSIADNAEYYNFFVTEKVAACSEYALQTIVELLL